MIIQLLFFFFLLTIIFLLSRQITSTLFFFFFLITGNKTASFWLLAIIVLPGTVIHELSHYFTASILRVKTGRISILPALEESGEVRTGRVYLTETDPFRFALIGFSPVITGLIVIYLIGRYFLTDKLSLSFSLPASFLLFVICYLLFAVSVTMYSSKKDLRSFIIVAPLTGVVFFIIHTLGIRIVFTREFAFTIEHFFTQMNYYLLLILAVDVLIFIPLFIIRWIFKKTN